MLTEEEIAIRKTRTTYTHVHTVSNRDVYCIVHENGDIYRVSDNMQYILEELEFAKSDFPNDNFSIKSSVLDLLKPYINNDFDPIHLDLLEEDKFFQAYSTNYVPGDLPSHVIIVSESDRDKMCSKGQIFAVETYSFRCLGMSCWKPRGMFIRYSIFLNLEDAIKYSNDIIDVVSGKSKIELL